MVGEDASPAEDAAAASVVADAGHSRAVWSSAAGSRNLRLAGRVGGRSTAGGREGRRGRRTMDCSLNPGGFGFVERGRSLACSCWSREPGG